MGFVFFDIAMYSFYSCEIGHQNTPYICCCSSPEICHGLPVKRFVHPCYSAVCVYLTVSLSVCCLLCPWGVPCQSKDVHISLSIILSPLQIIQNPCHFNLAHSAQKWRQLIQMLENVTGFVNSSDGMIQLKCSENGDNTLHACFNIFPPSQLLDVFSFFTSSKHCQTSPAFIILLDWHDNVKQCLVVKPKQELL